jgi:hypothetical protein
MAPDRTGLMIIRAWVEPGSARPLRAHLRFTTDVSSAFDSEVTLAEIEHVSSTVQTWLEDVLAEPVSEDESAPG